MINKSPENKPKFGKNQTILHSDIEETSTLILLFLIVFSENEVDKKQFSPKSKNYCDIFSHKENVAYIQNEIFKVFDSIKKTNSFILKTTDIANTFYQLFEKFVIDIEKDQRFSFICLILAKLRHLFRELIEKICKKKLNDKHIIKIMQDIREFVLEPIFLSKNNILEKVLILARVQQQSYQFLTNTLLKYLEDIEFLLPFSLTKHFEFLSDVLKECENEQKIILFLSENFETNPFFPEKFPKRLKSFALSSHAFDLYHELDKTIDNNTMNNSLEEYETKTHIENIIDSFFIEKKIFTFKSILNPLVDGCTTDDYVGIPYEIYEEAIIQEQEDYNFFLIVILLHEIAHWKGRYSYKKDKNNKRTPEKFGYEAGSYLEINCFGCKVSLKLIVENDIGKIFCDEKNFNSFSKLDLKILFSKIVSHVSKNNKNKELLTQGIRCGYVHKDNFEDMVLLKKENFEE